MLLLLSTAFQSSAEQVEGGKKLVPDSLTDSRDGQSYAVVPIDGVRWMAENLRYAHPGSDCYDDDPNHCLTYGRLYSYGAAQNVCPDNWRLPTVADWKRLRKVMGSQKADQIVVPGKWQDPAFENANNALGLSILPGGRKDEHGTPFSDSAFGELGLSSSFWLDHTQKHWHVRWGKSSVHQHGDLREQGRKFYVRCIHGNFVE